MNAQIFLRLAALCYSVVLIAGVLGAPTHAIEIGDWRKTCLAANWKSGEMEIVSEGYVRLPPIAPWFALTQRKPDGTWEIIYNITQIRANGLTPAARKFVFFHECAHASMNSMSEETADCEGLRALHLDTPVTVDVMNEIKIALLRIGRRFPLAPCPEFRADNK